MNTEKLRIQYLPDQVRFLFVGESPPANGKFFYEKSTMTTHMLRSFEDALSIEFNTNSAFFAFLKTQCCYLDDLSHTPVNKLDSGERARQCRKCIPELAERLATWQPAVVCICLKMIEPYVRPAIQQAGIQPKVYVLPFAGLSHQTKFKNQLTPIIQTHLTPPTPSHSKTP